MQAFIDKIEENIAELHFDDEQVLYISLDQLPIGVREGSFLDLNFILNKNKTTVVENNVEELINELSNNSEGGDFEI